jgi:hypothetical protein
MEGGVLHIVKLTRESIATESIAMIEDLQYLDMVF